MFRNPLFSIKFRCVCPITTATSIDGSSTVAFGFRNGQPVIADQNPVRGQGGFINIGFPLSRLFGANPMGRMAGFTAYLHYGYDEAEASDVRRLLGAATAWRNA
ncbi:MAG: hypothetical protein LH614_14790 [Pyrinomonadaceae bacterium]|nr:hypothetical protein [Pyrinomonadaceae bacterium]